MDVISHGLWGNLGYRLLPQIKSQPHLLGWGIFFSVFPDLFALSHTFFWLLYMRISGKIKKIPMTPEGFEALPIAKSTYQFYRISHSLIVWAFVFLSTWWVIEIIPWPMFGWALHILIDIPTHKKDFYATPFLWPLHDIKLNGYSWANKNFMAFNIIALISVYVLFFYF